MKIIFGHYSVTQTKKGGYKIQPIGMENMPWWVEKRVEYHPTLAKALNRSKKLGKAGEREVELALEQYDKQTDNFGVEAIRDPNQWIHFWCETRALYSNTGDTYITTLLYDTVLGKFRTMSWGDFVEKYDKKGKW